MTFLRNVLVFGLVSRGQSSSSEQMFSIQTDPATPTSSGSTSASATPSGGIGASTGLFPEQCSDDCTPVAQALQGCGLGDLTGFDVSCLCNENVENAFLTCIECAGRADPNPGQAVGSYQSLMDAYIQQCAYASVTLSSATVDLSSTSAATSTSGLASSSSASIASASTSSAASTSAPVSSSAPASSSGSPTSQAASSVSSIAASSTPSNPASRAVDQGWMLGLLGVGGVVVAAALGM